jgi:hypothetical protein
MELNFPRAPKPIQKRPLWKSAAVAVVSLSIIVIVFFFWNNPSAGCKLRGGHWFHRVDIESSDTWMDPKAGVCVFFYSDSGQPCENDGDCQGDCIQKDFGKVARVCSQDSLSGTRINFHGEWEYAP